MFYFGSTDAINLCTEFITANYDKQLISRCRMYLVASRDCVKISRSQSSDETGYPHKSKDTFPRRSLRFAFTYFQLFTGILYQLCSDEKTVLELCYVLWISTVYHYYVVGVCSQGK